MAKVYKHTRDVLRHSAIARRRRKVRNIKLTFFAIIILVVLCILIYVSRLSVFNIGDIQVSGLQSINTQVLIDKVNSELKGNRYLFIPKRNLFVYPKEEIVNHLKDDYPMFSVITLELVDGNTLMVRVDERLASMVVCNSLSEIYQNTFNNCVFIDNNGFAFATTTGIPDQSLYRIVVEENGVSTSTINHSILSTDKVVEIQKTVQSFLSAGYKSSYAKVIAPDSIEYTIDNGGVIKTPFNINENTLSILSTALKSKPLLGQKFEYVDVRFGNKVFYKLSGGSIGTSTSSTSTSKTLQKKR